MKVIDLLNKIANGEEVPKKIKYLTTTYTLRSNGNYYGEDGESNYQNGLYYQMIGSSRLNDEVEIIEDEPRDIFVCGSWFTKSEYNELARKKEDKKLKKLNIKNEKNCKNNWKWKIYGEEHSYNISTPQKIIADKINEIIDYLEEKNNE